MIMPKDNAEKVSVHKSRIAAHSVGRSIVFAMARVRHTMRTIQCTKDREMGRKVKEKAADKKVVTTNYRKEVGNAQLAIVSCAQ